jgi:hypothetical protein
MDSEKRQIPFGQNDVKLLVECASKALEAEDRHLGDCFKARHWRGSEQGICACWNERYYQFLIWSDLMFSFPWKPEPEWDRYDLAFFDNDANTEAPVAVAEIKGWGSNSGVPELEGIRADINALRLLRIPGVMLVFTAHIASAAEGNLRWLAAELGVNRRDMATASFRISTKHEGEWEFALVGFLANQEQLQVST